jgi:threonine aldolase
MTAQLPVIDLRSDTVTRPTPAMRQAMCQAKVGDDVMGEDPTVIALETFAAELCGKESALYVPSGTMANQAAVRAWCRNGDEALITAETHVFYYEAGAAAGLSGVQLNQVPSIDGIFSVRDFKERIRPDNDPHFPMTRLFWIENTHNRGGGKIVPFQLVKDLKKLSEAENIPLHVDGARLANAAVKTGIPLREWGALCDSLSLCLSKGLGAPVGSVLAGSEEFIQRCRRARKAMGGGMRQAGIIAAAGLYALQNNIDRLSVDHGRATALADELRGLPGLIVPDEVDTNILMVDLDSTLPMDAHQFQDRLEELGVKLYAVKERRVRAVFHLDLDDDVVSRTAEIFKKALG